MTKMPEVYLNQILLNIQHIEQFTQSGLETFLESSLSVRKYWGDGQTTPP